MAAELLSDSLHSPEQDRFDSGNYSENDPATSVATASLQHSQLLLTVSPSPFSSPVLTQTSTFTFGSGGGVTRRTNLHPEFHSEEYLYSPNASRVESSIPLATSTPNNSMISDSRPSPLSPYLQNLLQNFNSLYEQKLAEADTVSRSSKDGHSPIEMKNLIMEDWIRDLNEQNTVLIETVDEMEKEAEEKIHTLQTKVQRSAQMLIEHMHIIQEYEQQVQGFVKHRENTVRELDVFYAEAKELLHKKQTLEQKLEAVESEHSSLVKLITRIRDWGVWDISGLDFNPKTYKQLFDLYPRLPGSEVQTVFTQERALQVRENELKLYELNSTCEKLQEHQATSEKLALEKEKLITDLQKELIELNTKISALEIENQDYRSRLEETQGLLTKTILLTNQTTPYSNNVEMNQLVHELKELKEELCNARRERQTAMMEATALKAEMNHRLTDMAQMKKLLSTLQTETQLTKDKLNEIDEKQDKLSTLNEQAKFYEQKYIEAKNLLTNKATTIENLQSQLDLLYEKTSQMENEIGRWVLSRRASKPSNTQINHTFSILELNQNNNILNPVSSTQPDLLMSVKELQDRLRRLEEEDAEKDVIVKNLQMELSGIKSAKDELQAQISSRDAEIQMQKGLKKEEMSANEQVLRDSNKVDQVTRLGRRSRKHEAIPSKFPRWTEKEISHAEDFIEKIKLGADVLSARTHLLEKNFLIFDSHQCLTRLENDYLPLITSTFGPENENNNVISENDTVRTVGECTPHHLGDSGLTTLERQLVKERTKSSKLRKFVFEVLNQLEIIIVQGKANADPTMLEQGGKTYVSLMKRMQAFISGTERKLKSHIHNAEERNLNINTIVTKQTQRPHVSKYFSKFTSTESNSSARVQKMQDPRKMTAMQEVIRLQSEQIQRFERYLNRLHQEIREWMTPDGNNIYTNMTLDPDASPSVIDILRSKIEQDIQDYQSQETANTELNNQLEKMKVELAVSKKNESALGIENDVLRDIIAHVNKAVSKSNFVNINEFYKL